MRDKAIIAGYKRNINLSTRVVKSKKVYSRNLAKKEARKLSDI